ncbi:hypothetical protein L3X38_002936 [Prunus dulcis]|uniref:Uncharacterized protein n=1 Tax=Prunus dulcis TaxID=3755 RepID=A0AAD4WUX1_PRUDU|nr:hypothetical protein L3X38_002936 [Prunus dulcis]
MSDNSIIDVVAAVSANLYVSDSIPSTGSNTWIINTGASDHMTYDTKFFYKLSSNTHDPYITSANGLPSPITSEGTISLTPTLSLSRSAESRIEFPCEFSGGNSDESDAELPPELFGGSIVGSDDGLPYDVSKSWQNLFSSPSITVYIYLVV